MAEDYCIMQSTKHTPLIKEVGLRIQSVRQELGISQDALGQKVGLSRVSISQIENGRRKQLKPKLIRKIAGELQRPEWYFYGIDRDTELMHTSMWQGKPTSRLEGLIARLLSLSGSQQEELGEIIDRLITWYEQ